jgi:surfactin synthase thioesterase subunit
MNKTLMTLVALATLPAFAHAAPADFPTIDRFMFVNECMQSNGGSLDNMYKCSCVMDKLAEKLTYQQFQDGDVATHGANTGGERAALFRDPEVIKADAKLLTTVRADAATACNFNMQK